MPRVLTEPSSQLVMCSSTSEKHRGFQAALRIWDSLSLAFSPQRHLLLLHWLSVQPSTLQDAFRAPCSVCRCIRATDFTRAQTALIPKHVRI